MSAGSVPPAGGPGALSDRRLSVIDKAVSLLARQVARVARTSPTNFASELRRVTSAWLARDRVAPRFEYAASEHLDDALFRALDEAARVARQQGELGSLYADRAEELRLEAQIAKAAGSPELRHLTRARYGGDDSFATDADAFALDWVKDGPSRSHAHGEALRCTSDEHDSRSLISRLRAEIGERRLAVRIVVKPGLSPLAASARGVVYVADDRLIDDRATERTVLHEIEGHVLPEDRASRASLGIFSAATRRGSDDQEGYALVLEERNGFLDERRRGELGLRHIAARALHEGASFADACGLLLGHGAGVDDAVRIAMRTHRGGAGGTGGVGRERVYIAGYLRVRDLLGRDPSLEEVLRAGRVSCAAAPTLVPFVRQPSPLG